MNQQEWIEYFELVNGRKPTPAELAQAQAAGEFILERPNIFSSNGQVTEQRPIKPAEPVKTVNNGFQHVRDLYMTLSLPKQQQPSNKSYLLKKVCLRKLRLFWHQSLVP